MANVFISVALGLLLTALAQAEASAQATLNTVKQRGFLACGANGSSPGFGISDPKGNWTGFDVDFCRAVAASIFDDPTKARFVALAARDRFTALLSGEVDVLARNATATMQRETQLALDFPAVNYYDGQGFMVRKKLNVASARELGNKSVCIDRGTTTELNLVDYFRVNAMKFEAVAFTTMDEAKKAYDAGRCDAISTDMSALSAARLTVSNPDDHVILPEVISKEPLGPAVRHGDNQWGDIVKFTHMAMVNAEELGVTKANVEKMRTSDSPEIKRLLGTEGKFGEAIGLSNDWAYRIIKHVGNYGEVFERNLGEGSKLKIERGQNALWTKGGLQYGIPIR
jgi:general L-amino acid transport system substrate-binding protein